MSLLIQKQWLYFLLPMRLQILLIRPSGNTINSEVLEKMITGDIFQEKTEITKIHRFEFLRENIEKCIFTLV